MARYWAGFVGGKLDTLQSDTGFGGWGNNFHPMPAIFTSRDQARRQYQDVREVQITEVKKPT